MSSKSGWWLGGFNLLLDFRNVAPFFTPRKKSLLFLDDDSRPFWELGIFSKGIAY